MPREGYVDITISREAHEALQILKEELNVRSYNEAILRATKMVFELKKMMALLYNRRQIILPRRTEVMLGLT